MRLWPRLGGSRPACPASSLARVRAKWIGAVLLRVHDRRCTTSTATVARIWSCRGAREKWARTRRWWTATTAAASLRRCLPSGSPDRLAIAGSLDRTQGRGRRRGGRLRGAAASRRASRSAAHGGRLRDAGDSGEHNARRPSALRVTSIAVSRLARERPETEEKVSGFGGRADDKRRGAGRRARLVGASGSSRAVPRPLGARPERDKDQRAPGLAGTGRG